MGRSRWHVIEDEDGALTVTRRLPVRFDLAVETILEGTTGRRIVRGIFGTLFKGR